jgi:pimeloyl-ACP methyl ester carboxylesterase
MLNYYRANQIEDFFSLGEVPIESPTLVIRSSKEIYFVPETFDDRDHLITNLKQIVEPGSHWVFREIPDSINSDIHSFLES